MHFKVNKKEFSDAINIVSKAVSINSPLPVLHNIKLSVKEEYIQLTASDGDISIETIINDSNVLTIITTGDILLDGKYLADMIRKIDSDSIDIELMEANLCMVKGNAVNFEISGINAQDYPAINFDEPEDSFVLDVNTFKEIIFQTSFAASDKETKPILTGVNFCCEGKKLNCVASDSYRLAQKEVYIDTEHNFNVTIPAKNLIDISRILNVEDNIKIALDDKKALFIFDNVLVQTRLIDGLFPEVSRLIPTSHLYELVIDAREILNALDRASFIKSEGIYIVRLQISKENIVITSKSDDIISQEVISVVSYNGDRFDVSFKGNYLYDAIRSLNALEAKICFSGDKKPFIITSNSDDKILQLVLPIKTYD